MYNTLTDLMTGICNAVREKEGSSELIPSPDIPERIRGIKSSGELITSKSNGLTIPLKEGTIVPEWQGVSVIQLDFSDLTIFTQGTEE